MKKFTKFCAAHAAALMGVAILSLPAAATPTLGVSFSSTQSALCNHACIDGYQFTVPAAGITVVALGAFDGSQGGNPVGATANLPAGVVDLFNSAGAVVGTVNVGSGTSGTQVGLWEFITLTTPLGLTAGSYIVAYAPNRGADYDFSSFPITGSIGSGITYNQGESCTNIAGQFNGASCSLSAASLKGNGTTSLSSVGLGGNIEFNIGLPDPPPTGAPEPITLSIFGAGLAGAAALRRRNKAKA